MLKDKVALSHSLSIKYAWDMATATNTHAHSRVHGRHAFLSLLALTTVASRRTTAATHSAGVPMSQGLLCCRRDHNRGWNERGALARTIKASST